MQASSRKNLIFDEGGSSAVEFALIVPVFLAFVAGIAAYGFYFGASYSVQQLAANAARASVAGLTDAERKALATAFIAAAGPKYALLVSANIKSSAAALAGDANAFEVVVTYDSSNLPILNFAGFIPVPSKTIRRNSIVKRGGF